MFAYMTHKQLLIWPGIKYLGLHCLELSFELYAYICIFIDIYICNQMSYHMNFLLRVLFLLLLYEYAE